MGFKRDFTVSYLAGLLGGLVVAFSMSSSPFDEGIFWVYAIVFYLIVMLLTWIYGAIK